MKKNPFLILIVLTIFVIANQTSYCDDCVIYKLIYNDVLNNKNKDRFIIYELTSDTLEYGLFDFSKVKKKFPSNLLNLLEKSKFNIKSDIINNCFSEQPNFILKKEKQISFFSKTYNSKAWDNFYKEYPDYSGLIVFSNIVYSSDFKIALLSYSLFYDWNGVGYVVELRKIKNHWKIIKRNWYWG
jgi:hypothetical protein